MPTVTVIPSRQNVPTQLSIDTKPDYMGGQARVYISGGYVVKIYKKSKADTQERLNKIIQLGQDLGRDEQVLAWPLGLVVQLDGQPCIGCVSRFVPSPYVPLWKLIYSPVDAVKQFRQGQSGIEYLKIARSMAGAIRAIHDRGIASSDISYNNVLANPQDGTAVLIDLDSAIVRGFIRPEVGGTPKFQATELVMGVAQPSEKSDRHSAAVLLLWTLLFRHVMQPPPTACYSEEVEEDDRLGFGKKACFSEHPTDRRHWFARIGLPLYRGGALSYRTLTPKLQNLTEKALIEGLHAPNNRPTVRKWEQALAEAYDVLVICPTCKQSFIYPFWLKPAQIRQCPFCGTRGPYPFPAVLELLETGVRRGLHTTVRPLVLQHGSLLFADITLPGSLPPFTRRSTPLIGQVRWDKTQRGYRLVNMSDTPWQVIRGGSGQVRGRQSVALRQGLVLSFGPGKRLARVLE